MPTRKNEKPDPAPDLGGVQGAEFSARLSALLGTGSPSQRRLADFILRNPIRVAASSIDELSRIAGVSAPTISRFARELELSGFTEMRGLVARAMQDRMDPVSKLRENLRSGDACPHIGDAFDAVRHQFLLIDPSAVEHSALRLKDMIKAARTVYVMGFGISTLIAALLQRGVQPYHSRVIAVAETGGSAVAARNLMRIDEGDLLISITFPRYGFDAVNLTRFARDRGARIAVITDSQASPLCTFADELVLVPAMHPVLTNSLVGAVAVVETIVAAVMLSDPANVDIADRMYGAIADYIFRDPG